MISLSHGYKFNMLNSYIDSLKFRLWKTKGSRFNACRRLRRKQQISIFSISVLSVYGISIPVIQTVLDTDACPETNNLYTVISLTLSVFILVLSLLEGANNYASKSEKMHVNAMKISSLYSELEILLVRSSDPAVLSEKVDSIQHRYSEVIEECPDNHELEDYLEFQIQHRKEFNLSALKCCWIRVKYFFVNYWLYSLFVVVIPPFIVMLYSTC